MATLGHPTPPPSPVKPQVGAEARMHAQTQQAHTAKHDAANSMSRLRWVLDKTRGVKLLRIEAFASALDELLCSEYVLPQLVSLKNNKSEPSSPWSVGVAFAGVLGTVLFDLVKGAQWSLLPVLVFIACMVATVWHARHLRAVLEQYCANPDCYSTVAERGLCKAHLSERTSSAATAAATASADAKIYNSNCCNAPTLRGKPCRNPVNCWIPAHATWHLNNSRLAMLAVKAADEKPKTARTESNGSQAHCLAPTKTGTACMNTVNCAIEAHCNWRKAMAAKMGLAGIKAEPVTAASQPSSITTEKAKIKVEPTAATHGVAPAVASDTTTVKRNLPTGWNVQLPEPIPGKCNAITSKNERCRNLPGCSIAAHIQQRAAQLSPQ